jgi:hypothetical protein
MGMNRLLSIVAVLILALPALGEDYDRWYAVEMMGQRAGWMHMRQHTIDDRIESNSRMVLDVRRGEMTIHIEMTGSFVESTDGEPISMESVQSLGAIPTRTRYTFGGDTVSIETTIGEQTGTRESPMPDGAWLTPAAAASFVEQRIAAEADELVVRGMDPHSGLSIIETTMTRGDETVITVGDREIPVTKWETEASVMPGMISALFMDADGAMVASKTALGGIPFDMTATTREEAIAMLDPPEMMVSTLIESPEPIPNARQTTRASYLLRVPDGELTLPPSAGVQTATRIDDQTVRIDVDLAAPQPGETDASHLESSAMINTDDEGIAELAATAVRTAPDIAEKRAEAMRRFVNRHIDEKSLGVGFGSAAEVARSREGDCSEHAVLLAAMLRADGIPARVVSGLVYVPEFVGERNIFGYHMWTQALLERDGEPVWIDLDPTMPDDAPFDAAHIALLVSSLSDDEGGLTSMGAIAPLLGRLDIEIESIE